MILQMEFMLSLADNRLPMSSSRPIFCILAPIYDGTMWQIFTGSLILSFIHASIPNHWIPLIAVSRAEGWSRREALFATFLTGLAHTLSTVIIGIVVGLAGYKLSDNYGLVTRFVAPAVLVLLGIIYLVNDFLKSRHLHHHTHEHIHLTDKPQKGRSKWAILFSLGVAMFFSPCAEIEAYYFRAGILGWSGILTVSAVYTVTTVLLMMVLVSLGMQGLKKVESHYLEHHSGQITGIVLVGLGIIAFLTG